ncbi:hypothetical protein N836_12485 [Leptolyngbya sp. Heron Island J]|nr:hypothetical protein N836_12485 [Leptolyngbya sp. Heron Island J]
MVSEKQEEPPNKAAHFSQPTQQYPLTKTITPNKRVEVQVH